jgi:aminomethyltransferase
MDTQLKKTGLYDFHIEHGAKMVPFAGYSMPLAYGDAGQGESMASPESSLSLSLPSFQS